jgi:hypothetical protein
MAMCTATNQRISGIYQRFDARERTTVSNLYFLDMRLIHNPEINVYQCNVDSLKDMFINVCDSMCK